MKTNIGIETTDEDRERIAETLSLPYKHAKRDDIKEAINEYVRNVLIGGEKADSPPDPAPERAAEEQPTTVRDRSVRGFVPSRGDESYLYTGEDPELAAACSAVLDGLQYIEGYTWDTLERNRK